MKIAFQLAYKNLMGAGLRTWLNAGVLSFAFVVIIFYNGLIDGWNQQASIDGVNWEYGNGHLLNNDYDAFDSFSIEDGHGILPEDQLENLTPILINQATIYPQGRMMSAQLKGIDAKQTVIKIPTQLLLSSEAEIPALIGERMASSTNLKVGDNLLVRWRDKNGTYDAANVSIIGIFDTNVPTVDGGQIWIPIEKLWNMTGLNQHATMFIANDNYISTDVSGWRFESKEYLLKELTTLINVKKISGSIIYILLMAIGLLAIFDTQVLSVFRRQKEIGTYIALGMTRSQVVRLFTVEGSMYSVFAAILGGIYGIPILWYLAHNGIGFPVSGDTIGVIMSERMYPIYGLGLILGSVFLIVISATIVSFLPARKIAKMNPVEALKGKIS
ncbi:MAG: FtsX-like permease family protein [Bacteroidales bacterium]|nr:FtsX-like permease family protein [Bacteroidales bacterium]MDY0142398.1 FtsX-like permease family protein [Bacteroidales bacterium]